MSSGTIPEELRYKWEPVRDVSRYAKEQTELINSNIEAIHSKFP